MNCLTAEGRFSAYLEDELDYQTIREFEAHLANCSTCQTEFAAFHDSVNLLHQIPHIEPSSNFDRNLQSKIANLEVDKVPAWRHILAVLHARPMWTHGVIAAVLLVAVVGALFYSSGPTGQRSGVPTIVHDNGHKSDSRLVEPVDTPEPPVLPARQFNVPFNFGTEYSFDNSIRDDAMPRAPQHTQQNYILRTYDYSFVSSGGGL